MGRILHYGQIVEYCQKRCKVINTPKGIGLLPVRGNEGIGEGMGMVKIVSMDELISETKEVENELPVFGGLIEK